VSDRTADFFAADGFITRVDIRSVDQTYAFRARPARRREHNAVRHPIACPLIGRSGRFAPSLCQA
jgi:hypothetical protein